METKETKDVNAEIPKKEQMSKKDLEILARDGQIFELFIAYYFSRELKCDYFFRGCKYSLLDEILRIEKILINQEDINEKEKAEIKEKIKEYIQKMNNLMQNFKDFSSFSSSSEINKATNSSDYTIKENSKKTNNLDNTIGDINIAEREKKSDNTHNNIITNSIENLNNNINTNEANTIDIIEKTNINSISDLNNTTNNNEFNTTQKDNQINEEFEDKTININETKKKEEDSNNNINKDKTEIKIIKITSNKKKKKKKN